MADDGWGHVEETIFVSVSNAYSSLSGTVRQSDGTPVAGVAVLLAGRGLKLENLSEPDGRYAFFDVTPGRYRVRLGRSAQDLASAARSGHPLPSQRRSATEDRQVGRRAGGRAGVEGNPPV